MTSVEPIAKKKKKKKHDEDDDDSALGVLAVRSSEPAGDSEISAPFGAIAQQRGTGPSYKMRVKPSRPGTVEDSGLSGQDRAGAQEQAVESGADVPGPGPTTVVATSKIPIPGVTAELEHDDPFAAAAVYETFTGAMLQSAQRHDVALQADRRFALADLAVVEQDEIAYRKLLEGGPKKAAKVKEMEKKYKISASEGSGVVAMGEYREAIEEQVDLADRTVAISDTSIPLIDGTYEETRRVKVVAKTLTGGRSREHARERFAQKSDKVGLVKHSGRLRDADEAAREVQGVGRHVREAKMSADQLTVKVKQFQQFRQHVNDYGRSGNTKGTKVKRALKGVGGKVAGAVTGGVFRPEIKSTDGGHSGELDLAHGFVWNRVRNEMAALEGVSKSAAYGTATGFHVSLQQFMLILREIRDFLAGVAIWLAVAAIFAPPVIPFATVVGLIVVGLSALRAVLGTILLSWSLVQRAVTGNWRKKNQLNAQAVSQGGELLSDVAQTVAPTAAASAGNAGVLAGGYTTTLQQVQTHGFSHLTGQVGAPGGGVGMDLARTAATKTVGIGSGAAAPGIAAVGINMAQGGDLETRTSGVHQRHHAPSPDGRTSVTSGSPQRVSKPGWLAESEASETESLDAVTKALITRHAAKLGEFHEKTQRLVGEARTASTKAAIADGSTSTLPQMAEEENRGRLTEGQESTSGLAEMAAAAAPVAKRLSDPAELRKDLESSVGGGE